MTDSKDLKLELTDLVDLDELVNSTDATAFESTDAVAPAELDGESLEGVSSELANSLDIEAAPAKDIASAETALQEFQKLQTAQTLSITENTLESLVPVLELREEFVKNTAMRLYDEIHKQAKLFVREWCKINGFDQKWSNPFLNYFNAKFLHNMSEFVPQGYTVTVFNRATGEERVIAELKVTPREATITAAKTLGFDSSTRRALAFSHFSKPVIDLILKEERYLREQREIHIYEEHRRQIDARKYVPWPIRERWLREIKEKADIRHRII